MIRAFIKATRERCIARVQERMNGTDYCNIFQSYYLSRNEFNILQKDGTSIHTCSPDLNIIEYMWAELKMRLKNKTFRTVYDIWEETQFLSEGKMFDCLLKTLPLRNNWDLVITLL